MHRRTGSFDRHRRPIQIIGVRVAAIYKKDKVILAEQARTVAVEMPMIITIAGQWSQPEGKIRRTYVHYHFGAKPLAWHSDRGVYSCLCCQRDAQSCGERIG